MNILTNYSGEINKNTGCSSLYCNCDCHKSGNHQTKIIPQSQDKGDIFDILSEKVVNQRDLNDMVTTPRSIFKGYLCFTTGSAMNLIASMLDKGNISKGLSIAGSIISIYGTYNFVKPYLIKNKELTNTKK